MTSSWPTGVIPRPPPASGHFGFGRIAASVSQTISKSRSLTFDEIDIGHKRFENLLTPSLLASYSCCFKSI